MIRVTLTLAAIVGLSACGSSSDSVAPAPQPVPTPQPTATKFSDFVADEIANTTDTREPVEINDIDFDIGDDPDAFDALFPTGN